MASCGVGGSEGGPESEDRVIIDATVGEENDDSDYEDEEFMPDVVDDGEDGSDMSILLFMQPGQPSECVLYEGTAMEYMSQTEDPVIRFPIPNETQMRMKKAASTTSSSVPRKVEYRGAGSEVATPTDLPFSPPGPRWKGEAAITTSQLIAYKDAMVSAMMSNARRGTDPPCI